MSNEGELPTPAADLEPEHMDTEAAGDSCAAADNGGYDEAATEGPAEVDVVGIASPAAVESIAELQAAADGLISACREQVKLFEAKDAERSAEHTQKIADLDQTLATLKQESDAKITELHGKRDALTAEKKALENTYSFAKSKVKLDIGGVLFTTARSTLKTCKGSLLAAMVSGRYMLQPDEHQGTFFIDRDGRHFHHVLTYLRSPREYEPPADLESLNKILDDANFFRIKPLQEAITAAIDAKDIYR